MTRPVLVVIALVASAAAVYLYVAYPPGVLASIARAGTAIVATLALLALTGRNRPASPNEPR
jgi:hypothetical protein